MSIPSRQASGRTSPDLGGGVEAMFDFSGKTILYTGAAGGLGLDTTVLFLSAGAAVVAIDNDARKVEALQRAAAAGAERLTVAQLDLADLPRLGRELEGLSRRAGG